MYKARAVCAMQALWGQNYEGTQRGADAHGGHASSTVKEFGVIKDHPQTPLSTGTLEQYPACSRHPGNDVQ